MHPRSKIDTDFIQFDCRYRVSFDDPKGNSQRLYIRESAMYSPNTIRLIEQTNKIRTQSRPIQSINPHHSTDRNKKKKHSNETNSHLETQQSLFAADNSTGSYIFMRASSLRPHPFTPFGKHWRNTYVYRHDANNAIYLQYEKDGSERSGPGAECVTLKSNCVASIVNGEFL